MRALLSSLILLAGAFPARGTTPRSEALDAFERYTFTRTSNEKERRGVRTDAVVVLAGGKRIYEKYVAPYAATTPHTAWSVSKSVSHALLGVAILEGKLSLATEACTLLPSLAAHGHCGITLGDFLAMSSGFKWKEGYENDPIGSHDIEMLFGPGHRDVVAYVAKRRTEATPGTRWWYSSGDANVAFGMLRPALGREYAEYPWSRLFGPLGMTSAVFERDASGTFIGSDGVHATPRDLAVFGQLYLQDGVWEGRRLLPEGWVARGRKLGPGFNTPPAQVPWGHALHSGTWWINAAPEAPGLGKSWPSAPDDTFAALGYWGQGIFVIPSLGLVIARTADDRDETFRVDKFLALALAAFAGKPAPDEAADRDGGIFALPEEAAAFTAKQVCSCLFVARLEEKFCRNLGRQKGNVRLYIDRARGRVTGRFLLSREVARYDGATLGCTVL